MIPLRSLAAVVVLLSATPLLGQDWQASPMDVAPPSLFAEPCERANDGLPDGCVVRGSDDITAAWYTRPTIRYAHGILGDAVEAGGLRVRLASGAESELVLPDAAVFEDRTPRLVDLDRDGRSEVITIRSSVRVGGSIAIYGVRGETLVELGATPFIGRANRWLNVAGVADYLGRGDLQIAFVETPHIGGTLKLAVFDGRELEVVARLRGFSNHAIGAREQRLSMSADFDSDGAVDILLPDARRRVLLAVSFRGGANIVHQFEQLGSLDVIVAEPNSDPDRALVRTTDGHVFAISW